MTFAARRWRNIAATALVAGILVGAHAVYDSALYHGAFLSGWLLLVTILLLTLFGARKKVTMLPIGSSSTWLQVHVYAGWLSIVLFFLHVGWRIPDGWLETGLGLLFVLVAGSGIVGITLSRSLPKRLTRQDEEVIFERIPIFRARLMQEADKLVRESSAETQSSTIHDFYARDLADYFAGPRNVGLHLAASNRGLFGLLREIDEMRRYLSDRERPFADELRVLVLRKDGLDFHYALQLALKVWLFVHVPLTYSLLIVAALHLVLVYAFGGGVG